VKSFLASVAFLTRIPVGRLVTFDATLVARSAGWFPLVGLLLGIIYSMAAALLKGHLPSVVIAVLLVLLDAVSTGALHFDGLADTVDGFGGGKSREDVLNIMRDHAIGSYGATAIVILVALKVTVYACLLEQSNWIGAIILTPGLSRWSMLLLTATLSYARTSTSVVTSIGKHSLIKGTAVMAAALIVSMSSRAAIAAAVVVAVTFAFGAYCRHRIAGITGDTLGANLQLCESAALLTFLWAGSPQ
jgi:adenosylcobinamide-GDP ribazoletransferase